MFRKNIFQVLPGENTLYFSVNYLKLLLQKAETKSNMKKVTGIGGVFFKCDDPNAMNEWYAKNLGIDAGEYGATFEWRQADNPSVKGSTAWSTFPKDSQYFNPSTKPFMINYRVANLSELLVELVREGVNVIDEIAEFEYGKFLHILDPEGNVIELWEPKPDYVWDEKENSR